MPGTIGHYEFPKRSTDAERLCRQLGETAEFLDVMANTLDEWAEQSRSGGWSTHQVEANRARANDCRRQAAHIRSVLS